MWIVFREFLVNLGASAIGELSSPSGLMGYLVALGFIVVAVVGWHSKRVVSGKRGVDSWYFIALAAVVAVIAIAGAAYGIGLRSAVASSVPPQAEKPVTAPIATPSTQLARLRVHYTSVSPSPEVIEADNVLKPMSFQFVDGGNQQDPKSGRNAKWTLLILTFDKPVTGESVRVLFEGGDIPHERKNFTSRNLAFLFEGSVADKTIQIEVRP
jgi:hypothetical protein